MAIFENNNQKFETRMGEAFRMKGDPGASAYDIARANGFEGTEAEWLASLKGDPGETGPAGPQGDPGKDAEPYTLPVASADTLGGVKVGEGLQMAGDVLGVKPEGVYELIETITMEEAMAIERTEEPDGTPYAFVALLIRIYKPATVPFGKNIYTFATTSDGSRIQLYVPATSNVNEETYLVIEIKSVCGFYEVLRYPWGLITAPSQCTSVKAAALNHKVSVRGNIVGYSSGGIPLVAGCKYEIWGVRANA